MTRRFVAWSAWRGSGRRRERPTLEGRPSGVVLTGLVLMTAALVGVALLGVSGSGGPVAGPAASSRPAAGPDMDRDVTNAEDVPDDTNDTSKDAGDGSAESTKPDQADPRQPARNASPTKRSGKDQPAKVPTERPAKSSPKDSVKKKDPQKKDPAWRYWSTFGLRKLSDARKAKAASRYPLTGDTAAVVPLASNKTVAAKDKTVAAKDKRVDRCRGHWRHHRYHGDRHHHRYHDGKRPCAAPHGGKDCHHRHPAPKPRKQPGKVIAKPANPDSTDGTVVRPGKKRNHGGHHHAKSPFPGGGERSHAR